VVKEYFWILRGYWTCRRNLGGVGRNFKNKIGVGVKSRQSALAHWKSAFK